jgi:hypothetical protein
MEESFDYIKGLDSNDLFLIAKSHVYELVIEKGLSYQEIRMYKSEHPLLDYIADDKIFKWVLEAKEDLPHH